MTMFARRAHLRTSVNGVVHSVRGHDVDREDWASGRLSKLEALAQLEQVGVRYSFASSFAVPNASCPVCGASVFFYQNAHGSRVFFDDLGPPWPKHPCTSTTLPKRPATTVHAAVKPLARPASEISYINSWLDDAQRDLPMEFFERHRTSPWTPLVVERRFSRRASALIAARTLEVDAKRMFFKAKRLSRFVKEKTLVFQYRSWLAFVDEETCTAVDGEVERITSASEFVNQLVR